MKVLFNNLEGGDKRLILEEDSNGNLYLSTNAETRKKITPMLYFGWEQQRDEEAALKWIAELTEDFCGDSNLARRFAIAAGAAIPEEPEEAEFSVFLEHKL